MKTINYDELDFSEFFLFKNQGSIEVYTNKEGLEIKLFKGDEEEHFWVDPINFNVVNDSADSEDLLDDGYFNLDSKPEYCFDLLMR